MPVESKLRFMGPVLPVSVASLRVHSVSLFTLFQYTINDRSISCRRAWHLKTYDINETGQVHTCICYLATLPYEEQLYWQSFNEWSKGNISRRAHQTDILGEFSTEDDPLAELKGQVELLDRDPPTWWQPRGERLLEEALYPATDSIEERGNEILALDHLVIEGFLTKGLRSIITANGDTYECHGVPLEYGLL